MKRSRLSGLRKDMLFHLREERAEERAGGSVLLDRLEFAFEDFEEGGAERLALGGAVAVHHLGAGFLPRLRERAGRRGAYSAW